MSQISVDSVIPQSGTTITVGASGDTVNLGSGASTNGFLPSAISVSGTDFQFNSGYGSTATAYGCRAWVNFNGTGTVAIRESGNVSSVTDSAVGRYTVNFLTSLPDNVYSVVSDSSAWIANSSNLTTSSISVDVFNGSGTFVDSSQVMSAIFR
jgi:hypothetical protein